MGIDYIRIIFPYSLLTTSKTLCLSSLPVGNRFTLPSAATIPQGPVGNRLEFGDWFRPTMSGTYRQGKVSAKSAREELKSAISCPSTLP